MNNYTPVIISEDVVRYLFDLAYRKGYRRAVDTLLEEEHDYDGYLRKEEKNYKKDLKEFLHNFSKNLVPFEESGLKGEK